VFCTYVDIGAYETPTVWFVDADATASSKDGKLWENAYIHLQDALAELTSPEDHNGVWVTAAGFLLFLVRRSLSTALSGATMLMTTAILGILFFPTTPQS